MKRLGWGLVLACLVSGCSTLNPTAPPVRTYRLDYPPPAASAPPTTATLRVHRFGAVSPYDQLGFVYRDGQYDIAVDGYNRWLSDPSGMVTALLARDFAATRQYQAVVQTVSALPSDYELSGEIETLEEQAGGGCTAALRLRVILMRVPATAARSVVFQDSFAAEEPCRAGDPNAFAAAVSRALQQISDQLQVAVLAAVRENERASSERSRQP